MPLRLTCQQGLQLLLQYATQAYKLLFSMPLRLTNYSSVCHSGVQVILQYATQACKLLFQYTTKAYKLLFSMPLGLHLPTMTKSHKLMLVAGLSLLFTNSLICTRQVTLDFNLLWQLYLKFRRIALFIFFSSHWQIILHHLLYAHNLPSMHPFQSTMPLSSSH